MTKHERVLIRSCISNGFEFRHDMRVAIGKETLSRDRFDAIAEEVELALDKQEPVKPIDLIYYNELGLCSCCESGIDKTMKYCYQCGQRINWEVDTDEQY